MVPEDQRGYLLTAAISPERYRMTLPAPTARSSILRPRSRSEVCEMQSVDSMLAPLRDVPQSEDAAAGGPVCGALSGYTLVGNRFFLCSGRCDVWTMLLCAASASGQIVFNQ
jgi:hypothetical protein